MAQREVSVPQRTADATEEGDEVADGREACGFFLGYASSRDEIDPNGPFTPEVRQGLSEEKERAGEVEGVDFATEQGAKLGRYGDLLDGKSKDEMKEIIEMLVNMSPKDALENFKKVVKNIFLNERGETNINVGRVVVLLALCYELCVAYIKKKTGCEAKTVVAFIISVASWLWMTFLRYKLNEWLKAYGGWGKLVATATNMFAWPGGKQALLLVGVVSLSLWVISYFWGPKQ